MIDPTNRAFQERFYDLIQRVDRVTALRLIGWFADAAHGAGCLKGGLHLAEAGPAPLDETVEELEDNIRQLVRRQE